MTAGVYPLVGLCIALSTVGCGALPEWPADADARSFTIPLVMAWRPTRALVEVRIGDAPPMLMALDTTRSIGSLPPDVVERLRLPRSGDPTRGARVMADRVTLGEVTLRRVRFAVEPRSHGLLFGRPVMGVIGNDWFAGRRLVHDPATGVLRVVPRSVEPPPGATIELQRDGDGWRVPISMAGVAFEPLLDTDAPTGALSGGLARRILEAAGNAMSVGVTVGAADARPGPWRVADSGDDTLSMSGLHGLGWRIDSDTDRLHVWPARQGPARFARFGDQPDCGPRFAACLTGHIAAVRKGRVDLAFETPTHHLAERYWMRIDLGPGGRPYSALVQIRPRPAGADGPLVAHIEDQRIEPSNIAPVGAPLRVLDIVPSDVACGGVTCLHRQEGDAAELIMESSGPADEAPRGGVAPEPGPAPVREDRPAPGRAPPQVEPADG